MNKEEINLARERYKILMHQRDKLIQQINRMNQLSENDKVAEFITLCNELNLLLNVSIPTNEELAYKAFNDIALNTKDPCNIYLELECEEDKFHSYLGTPYRLTYDERRIFKNLENNYRFYNFAEKKDVFLSNNTIILCTGNDSEEKIKKLKSQYFLNLIKDDTETAIQKTIKKFK